MALDEQKTYYGGEQADNSNSFQIKEFLNLIWINKYWILLSVIVCTAIALYQVYRQPRIYGSNAELIVLNSNSNSYTGTGLAAFSDIKGMGTDVNMYNEMEVLKSPYVMEGVVQRLNLNTNYTVPGFGYNIDLYGKSPVTVNILDKNPDYSYSMTVARYNDDKVKVGDFILNGKELDTNPIIVPIGKIVKSPVGKLAITSTEDFRDFDATITVHISPVAAVAKNYSTKISAIPGAEFTSIIKLSYNDVSQDRANDVLNTLMDVYNETWITEKNRSAVNTSNFINERLAVIEKELSGIDEDISNAKSSSQMPDFTSAAQNFYSQSVNYDNRAFEASNQLSIATYLRDYLRDPKKANELIPANSGLTSGAIESQIQEYNKMLIKRDNLLQNSTAANPVIAELNSNLLSMRQVIMQSLDNLIATNEIQINKANSRGSAYSSKVSAVPEQQKEILSIERQQKVKENLYLYLLQKREENELTGMITVNNTRLIREATSLGPVAPVRTNYMITGAGVGLLLPIAIIFLYIMLNTRVHSKNDLAALTIPFIGEVPLSRRKRKRKISLRRILHPRSRKIDDEEIEIVVKEKSRNQINESFRMIRTSLDFMTGADESSKVLMLTSFNPGSGKTFISLNLATSLALKDGKRVLVADLDLRRASLSKFIGSPARGISSYLTGKITDAKSLISVRPEGSIIDILPVGALPPNPAELLLGNRYEQLINELKQMYDYIILDCPPLGIVADTTISARKADLSVFVVRAGLFDKSMIPELEEVYNEKKLPHMSIILNGIDTKKSGYGYRYGYGYGYGYYYGGRHNYYTDDSESENDEE